MSFLKSKKFEKTVQWLSGLDFSNLNVDDIIDDITEEKIQHILKMLQSASKNRNSPSILSAAKVTCRIAYPKERIEGIRKRIFDAGVIPELLYFGQQGYIRPFSIIERSEITVGEELAKGSGGSVYEGKWQEKNVAIKVCGKMGMFFTCEEAFRFETTVMSLLEHPNIMRCYGANAKDPEPFIIMPLLEYGNLSEILKDKKRALQITLSQKLHIAIQLADAMKHMHKCGLIHRDLKPSNVLVGADYSVSLIDFGISRIWEGKRPMTMNVGTTAWIAPEIFEGNGIYSNSVDVYSFGMILYEIMTCMEPYKSIGLQSFDIPLQVVKGVRPTVPDSIPEEIRILMQQCWGTNSKKRPSFEKIQERLLEIQSDIMWFRRPATGTTSGYIKESSGRHNTFSEEPVRPKFARQMPSGSGARSQFIGRTTGSLFTRCRGSSRGRGQSQVNIGTDRSPRHTTSPGALLRNPPKEPAPPPPRDSNTNPDESLPPEEISDMSYEQTIEENPDISPESSPERGESAEVSEEHEDTNEILERQIVNLLGAPDGYECQFAQEVKIRISSMTYLEGMYWLGTETGNIVILKDTPAGCKLVHQFVAHRNVVSSLLAVESRNGNSIWSTSLSETSSWNPTTYEKLWDYPDTITLIFSCLIEINNHSRVWTAGNSNEDCAMRVWNPSDCRKVSKVIIVPPEGVDSLEVSCVVKFDQYVLIGADKWIYIFDGLSYEALSYWKAHDCPIKSISVMDGKIWSCSVEGGNEVKIWFLSMQAASMLSLKLIPFRDYKKDTKLSVIQNIENNMWCFYEDGNITIIGSDLKQKHSSTWKEEGGVIQHLIRCDNRIIFCTNQLLVALKPSNIES